MTLLFAAATHRGNKRKTNEDRYSVRHLPEGSLLIAVADGMGGLPGGDKAATLAIEVTDQSEFAATVDHAGLIQVVREANKAVIDYAARHPALDGMGTTLTVAVVRQESVFWTHVGDSRLYLLQSGKLSQMTSDHRFLTSMIADGDISAEEAKVHPLRNVLDQCLGYSAINPEVGAADLAPGNTLLLCTDGLYEDVPHETIASILNQTARIEDKAALLVQAALGNGGRDNITLVIIERNL